MACERTGLIAVCLFLSLPIHAQQAATPSSAPVKDAQALALVQAAIQALGGESAIKQLQTVAFQGSMTGASQSNYAATWQPLPKPQKAAAGSQPQPITAPFTPASVTAALIRQLHSGLSLKYVGPVASGGNTLTVVTFHANFPTPAGLGIPNLPDQTWYFNQANLPTRIEYQITSQPGRIQLQAIDFSDYRTVSGVQYPFEMALHRDDQQTQTITIQRVTPTLSTSVVPTN